jgi:hypothetical protein
MTAKAEESEAKALESKSSSAALDAKAVESLANAKLAAVEASSKRLKKLQDSLESSTFTNLSEEQQRRLRDEWFEESLRN